MSLDIVLFHNLVPPAYRQRPLALHGITCVHREVEQDLCDLRLVHQDVPRRQLVVTDDLHGGRQGLLQQYQGRVEPVSDFRGYRQDHGAAAEGQQSFRERSRLTGGGFNSVQVLQQRVRCWQVAPDDGDVAQDAGQQVVEIMGDATCQLADGLHLLRLSELSFRLLALGDVGEGPHTTNDLITDSLGLGVTPENAPVCKIELIITRFFRLPIQFSDFAQKRLRLSHLLENIVAVSYTHLRAHETRHDLVCRLLLEKK